MADYHLDMAFDWDSEAKGGYDGFLQTGLVLDSAGAGSNASLAQLSKNDTIEFYLYDVSESADTRTVALPATGSWISFSNADANTNKQSPTNTNLASPVVASGGNGTSTVFGGPYPCWALNASANQALSMRINNDGRYFFTVQFSITNSQGVTKTFGVDPEMIVKV